MKKEIKFKILLFYPNTSMLGVAPTTLAILSACLKQYGFQTKLFDCSIYKNIDINNDDLRSKLGHVKESNIHEYFIGKNVNIYEDFIKIIEDYKPDLIAASVIDSTITFTLDFIKLIKDKKIPILFGGVGATFAYEKILNSNLVNFVCIGEGEKTIVELCEKLNLKQDCSKIKNIYIKKDDKIIKNPLRLLIDINKTPTPDFSIYEYYRFYRPFFGKVRRILAVDMDRGCPFSCTYCAAPALRDLTIKENIGKYYRIKSFNKIFNEINELVEKYKINHLLFNSETFTALPTKQFKIFANRYKKEVNLPFSCQSRLDTINKEKAKLLYEMGCKSIALGLEHGSEKIRKELLNKKLSNKRILKSFEELSKYDIIPGINIMIGLPDETRENVFETISLTRKVSKILNKKHTTNVFTFLPFHGTKLREFSIKKGYITGDEDIPISFFDKSLLNMSSMSKDEIYGLEKTFVLYVLLPKSYYNDIKIAEQNNKEGYDMFNKLMLIKNNKYNVI